MARLSDSPTASSIARPRVRAAVTDEALAVFQEHVDARGEGIVEVVRLERGLDLEAIDFLVPGLSQRTLEAIRRMPRLAVVQPLSAGTDRFNGFVPDEVTLCSARGARDAPMSEWIIGALLGASSHLLSYARTRSTERRRLIDLSGWTVLIVGLGSIGSLTRDRLKVFGTNVIGVASRPREDAFGVEDLAGLLPQADAVVVLTPLSDSTRGLIGRDELAAMRDGAVLINAARGQIVDADALLDEVVSGRLHAVLDVTDPEPLPADHPLLSAPGVLAVTPHIAGDSNQALVNAARFAGDQILRWLAGEPLLNVVHQGTRQAPPVSAKLADTAGTHPNQGVEHD